MTQGRWGLGRPCGQPLKTSVHTQNINVKKELAEPMENPSDSLMVLVHRPISVKYGPKTAIDSFSMH
jgi:hypothetical protein